jgi:TatD DNase family protein
LLPKSQSKRQLIRRPNDFQLRMTKMTLIDTHAHLYSSKFEHDRHDMVRRALGAGVTRIYLPNIDASSTEAMLALESAFPEHCFAMMGLHPCSVQPDTYLAELATVEKWLGQRAWAGVGETGIDLYWEKNTLGIQQLAFERQCIWARELGLPIVIHSREANREALDVVKKTQNGRLHGIFHCFSGTLDEAKEMIDLNFVLGIGGTLTYPKSDLPQILREIPLEHLVLETDAPYLPPVPHRGKRNESAFVRHTAEALSEAKVLPLAEIARVTTATALRVFGHAA